MLVTIITHYKCTYACQSLICGALLILEGLLILGGDRIALHMSEVAAVPYQNSFIHVCHIQQLNDPDTFFTAIPGVLP